MLYSIVFLDFSGKQQGFTDGEIAMRRKSLSATFAFIPPHTAPDRKFPTLFAASCFMAVVMWP